VVRPNHNYHSIKKGAPLLVKFGCGPSGPRWEFYRRAKGSKAAKVVTARRLGCIVYRVLKEKQPYYERLARSRGFRQAG
jgi:hypothetical protein